ncbi:MAG: hypothetical protein LBH00_02860 [Planctomycetaceae bacterium]|nr:hypothetical protein [Planctomycetaceae bacterium]
MRRLANYSVSCSERKGACNVPCTKEKTGKQQGVKDSAAQMTMRYHYFLHFTLCCVLAVFSKLTVSAADAPPEICAEGLRLIQSGKLEEASELMKAVFGTNWQHELDDLCRIAELKQSVLSEKNDIVWRSCAEQLRTLYLQKKMFAEGEDVARKIFVRMRTLTDGLNVAETFLTGGQADAAMKFTAHLEKTFGKSEPGKTEIEMLKCRILLAKGEKESAKKSVRQLRVDAVRTPDSMFQLAQIQAATRQYASSVRTLIRCFEESPPAVADILKKNAAACPAFQPIREHPEFMNALKTKSLVPDDCPACVRGQISRTGTY